MASIKGYLYSELNDVKIIDISHLIMPFNIEQAAYIINSSFYHFPNETIHVILVDARTKENKWIAAKIKSHYFICADNGIISLICPDTDRDVIEIDYSKDNDMFSLKKIFFAKHLVY